MGALRALLRPRAIAIAGLAGAALTVGSGRNADVTRAVPRLFYASYLGGPDADEAFASAVDPEGNFYVTGVAGPRGLSVQASSTRRFGPGGGSDAFVAKITPTGGVAYLVYIGGAGHDEARAIQVDAYGNVWVAGRTNSTGFPTTPFAFQRNHQGGWEAFLARLDADGENLSYSTLLGGSADDEAFALALSSYGDVVVAGRTASANDFPTSQRAWQRRLAGGTDGFVCRFSREGLLVFSTLLGGLQADTISDVAIDWHGDVLIAGATRSADFPIKDAVQPVHRSPSAYKSQSGAQHWTALELPARAFVRVWAFHPSDASIIYAGTTTGILKSTDGGATWAHASAGLTSLDVQTIAVDPRNPAIVYAGTNGGGVFRSLGAGDRWTPVNAGLANANVRWLAIDPSDSNVIYAATAGGIYKSADAGRTWSAAHQGLGAISLNMVAIDPRNPATLYAASSGAGAFKSTNGGNFWTKISEGLAGSNVSWIAIDPANPAVLYLANVSGGMFKSTDGGNSWAPARTGIPAGSQAYYVAVDPANPATVYLSTNAGFFRSEDRGETWQRADAGAEGFWSGGPRFVAVHPATRLLLLACIPSNDAFAAKLDGGGGGLVWATFLGGIARDEALGLAVDHANQIYVAGLTYSTDLPVSPNALQGVLGGDEDAFLAKLTPDGGIVYVTYLGGGMAEEALDIAAAEGGEVVVAGWSRGDMPVSADAVQRAVRGGRDAFIAVVEPNGAAVRHCTYLGGRADDRASTVALDSTGILYLAGRVASDNFPLASPVQAAYAGSNDAFIARLGELLPAGELTVLVPEPLVSPVAGSNYFVHLRAVGGRPPYAWAVQSGVVPPGLALDPATGVLSGTPTTPGVYSFILRLTETSGTELFRPVTIVVHAPPKLTITTGASLPSGGVNTPYSFTLTAAGGTPPYEWELAGGSLPPGLSLQRAVGRIGGTPTTVGSFPFKVRVTDRTGAVHTKDFTIVIVPPVVISEVLNAASWLGGAVAPGEIVTLTGEGIGPGSPVGLQILNRQLMTTLGETQVLFDGIPAPLLYVQQRQVSAIVPYAVAGTRETKVEVRHRGALSNALLLKVVPSAPGIFTQDASGRGQGAILNQDYTLNSPANPAEGGTVVLIYATGEGETDPQVADGYLATAQLLPRPKLPVRVSIAGLPSEVLYAGAVPGMVAGLLQVNVRVPAGLPASTAVPVVLTVGEASSQPGVTMAIK